MSTIDPPTETTREAVARLTREGRTVAWIACHLSITPRRVRVVQAMTRTVTEFPSAEVRARRALDTTAILSSLRGVG